MLDTTGGWVAEVVQRLAGWMSARIDEPALAVPALATEPVYSTWYTFTQAGVVLWVAPLLLGMNSNAYADLAEYATLRRKPDDCFILDPRHRAVREHLADVSLRLVTDYEIDGLKIDFLDTAMRYQGTSPVGDARRGAGDGCASGSASFAAGRGRAWRRAV